MRLLLQILTLGIAFLLSSPPAQAINSARSPNLVIIMADDLGYGDLGCYGHPSIRTPCLDRMAAEGLRFTDFYCGSPVCTPSRAALLTGRLPIRSGMAGEKQRVLFPNSKGGLPATEITIAKLLKTKGYATACIGKWHLGHLPPYLPTRHGFDYYFGLPYSNDMDLRKDAPKGASASTTPELKWWNVPLLENDMIIERPVDQHTLTRRYTDKAIDFIKQNKTKPFFVYLPHTFPHVPLFASKEFKGKSLRGLYGDVVEELDASTGRILDLLRKEKLAENTLVIFTSDNGPWLIMGTTGGSAGLLRDGKGSTWEGGMRVPCIAWWPGKIKPGVTHALASLMDLFNTSLALAGADVPRDRPIDGVNLLPVLLGTGPGQRELLFYYRDTKLFAVRKGPYKLHLFTKSSYGKDPVEKHDPPLLYNLDHDPSERFNVAAAHKDVIADIMKEIEKHQKGVVPVESQLDK